MLESPVLKKQPQTREEITGKISEFYVAKDADFVKGKNTYQIVRNQISKDFNTISPREGAPFSEQKTSEVRAPKSRFSCESLRSGPTPDLDSQVPGSESSKKMTDKRKFEEKVINEMINIDYRIPTEQQEIEQIVHEADFAPRSSVHDFLPQNKKEEIVNAHHSPEKSMPINILHTPNSQNESVPIKPYVKDQNVTESIPTETLLGTGDRFHEDQEQIHRPEIVVSPITNQSPVRSPGNEESESPLAFTRLSEIKRRLQAQKEIELSSLQSSSMEGSNSALQKAMEEYGNYTIQE